ncbi:Glycerol-3-phosphate O-acyltransferase 2 [Candida viswanathii]|uniref:Glycerol-3-phosphate O-acyltransferase 2 n=1 Tax=Candida viswanathii TaxID=5486 RepID=A0A367XQW5_9ASCO|nr:Glycerol-3-phosphate O-acyltransferase 2 [Candida viswanathii]
MTPDTPATHHRQKINKTLWYYLSILLHIFSYDSVLFFFYCVINTFFRDIKTRGGFDIPNKGPVIFVIAPHHNQFVDGLVVMTKVKEHTGRRIAFLIAKKSYERRIIGDAAKLCGAIPVERAQDLLKKGQGEIFGDLNDDCLLIGKGTKFTEECQVKGLIGLPNSLGNCQISSIEDDEHLTLKKPFGSKKKEIQEKIDEVLKNGTLFKIAPHIDNHVVFQNVFDHLNNGHVLGIFPEGGSHDRPDLLPLKPGVAIMALGAISQQMEEQQNGEREDGPQPITIVPVGLNYFHPHKFRSRVVMEFGKSIVVDKSLGEQYMHNPRDTVDRLLKVITLGLKEVTVTCNDYDTLMVLQAARRLYTSADREQIPTPMVIEMNRRLIKGYEQYKNEPDVKELRDAVTDYNRRLMRLSLHDHQVESLNQSDKLKTFKMFVSRFFLFSLFMGLSLPGLILFSPVFITGRRISAKKAKEALAASSVKIKAKDVLSTWKILVAMVLAPALYIFYSVIGTILIVKLGLVPNISVVFIFLYCYFWAVLTTYASLRVGEIGVDYYKSLKPLFISLISHDNDQLQIKELKETREALRKRVTLFCNKLGPGIFDDYDKFYRQYNHGESDHEVLEKDAVATPPLQRQSSYTTMDLTMNNLSDIQIFAAADLEQASDISLTKSSSDEEMEEKQDNDEEVIDKASSKPSNASVRLRKAMKEKQKQRQEEDST